MQRGKIRHIAIVSPDPEKLAGFYKSAFGMTQVPRGKETGHSIHLSDGEINLTILKQWPEADDRDKGYYHIGFTFETNDLRDVQALNDTMKAAGASREIEPAPVNPQMECRVWDPDGNPIDLAPLNRWNY